MSSERPSAHWAQWSFETDSGYHGQIRDQVLYVRNANKEPHLVTPFEELVVEIGQEVRLRDSSGWFHLDIGTVRNMLKIRG
jgi:hypothetical protein